MSEYFDWQLSGHDFIGQNRSVRSGAIAGPLVVSAPLTLEAMKEIVSSSCSGQHGRLGIFFNHAGSLLSHHGRRCIGVT